MMQPTNTARIYPNINPAAMSVSSGRYSPTAGYRARLPTSGIFSPFDDPFLQARAAQAALAEMDVKNVNVNVSAHAANMLRTSEMFSNYHNHGLSGVSTSDAFDHTMSSIVPSSSACMIDPNSIVHQATADSMVSLQQQVMAMQHHYPPPHFAQYPGMPQAFTSVQSSMCPTSSINAAAAAMAGSGCIPNPAAAAISRYPLIATHNAGYSLDEASNFRQVIGTFADLETDPRELERFAEHFKQRRIKLGVTQADVGKALAHLKMPGVGSLSQSTICRFESLTLSHNNMVALKPILHSWLEKAEDVIKNKNGNDEGHGILPNTEKKRKRTSIAAPEKRLLEDYFRQQPRPTGDRISAIAEKLDLKKNVVRVWFCNQRQKQKRSQFRNNNRNPGSSQGNGSSNGVQNGGRSPNSPTDSDHSDSKCPSSQPQALQPNPQQQQQPFAELNMEALGSLDMKAAGIGLFYQCNNQN